MIDYKHIADAVRYYTNEDYQHLDVPWVVGDEAYNATRPPNTRAFSTFLGNLVASGEQSFLQMMLHGKLGQGRWFCVTPCFRDETHPDELHLPWFLKVELIDCHPEAPSHGMWRMIEDARRFFEQYLPCKVVDTSEGYDIVSVTDIELGSYGIREFEGHTWIYGTGCAEPRLRQAIIESGLR